MIDRDDKAKAKDGELKSKSLDSQCTSMNMPRTKVSRIHFRIHFYACAHIACVFL